MIDDNPVVLFSVRGSAACRKAKSALASAAAVFVVVELENLLVGDIAACVAYLGQKTGRISYPWTFVAGRTVGDEDNVASLQASGRLAQMCASAGTPSPTFQLVRATSQKSCGGGDDALSDLS